MTTNAIAPATFTMLDEEVVRVDIFTPVREDFLPADAGGRA